MPSELITQGDGVRINFWFEGPASAPVLILANSIATTLHMWDGLAEGLSQRFRVLRYDYRGHGGSDIPPGAYSLDRFGRDVLELMDHLEVGRANFLGLSLGGLVGQWLAIRNPERLQKLVLSNTAAALGPPSNWDNAIAALSNPDMDGIADFFVASWFPRPLIEAAPSVVRPFREMVRATSPAGLAGTYALLRDADLRPFLPLIKTPTMVIGGQFDTITSPAHAQELAANIQGATLRMIPSVHLPSVEQPNLYRRLVSEFLDA